MNFLPDYLSDFSSLFLIALLISFISFVTIEALDSLEKRYTRHFWYKMGDSTMLEPGEYYKEYHVEEKGPVAKVALIVKYIIIIAASPFVAVTGMSIIAFIVFLGIHLVKYLLWFLLLCALVYALVKIFVFVRGFFDDLMNPP